MAEEAATAESEASESASTESETTFTQAQVNDLIAKEKGKIQSKYGDYNELKSKADKLAEIEAASATDLEKVQKKAAQLEQEKAAAESKLLRYEVANDKSVPADVVEFLKGNTREELEASAEKLLSFTSKQAATPDFDGGARETSTDPQQADTEAFITQLLGIQPTQ